jgi:hypothetical protein
MLPPSAILPTAAAKQAAPKLRVTSTVQGAVEASALPVEPAAVLAISAFAVDAETVVVVAGNVAMLALLVPAELGVVVAAPVLGAATAVAVLTALTDSPAWAAAAVTVGSAVADATVAAEAGLSASAAVVVAAGALAAAVDAALAGAAAVLVVALLGMTDCEPAGASPPPPPQPTTKADDASNVASRDMEFVCFVWGFMACSLSVVMRPGGGHATNLGVQRLRRLADQLRVCR